MCHRLLAPVCFRGARPHTRSLAYNACTSRPQLFTLHRIGSFVCLCVRVCVYVRFKYWKSVGTSDYEPRCLPTCDCICTRHPASAAEFISVINDMRSLGRTADQRGGRSCGRSARLGGWEGEQTDSRVGGRVGTGVIARETAYSVDQQRPACCACRPLTFSI